MSPLDKLTVDTDVIRLSICYSLQRSVSCDSWALLALFTMR